MNSTSVIVITANTKTSSHYPSSIPASSFTESLGGSSGAFPQCHLWKAGRHPGQGASSSQGAQSHSLIWTIWSSHLASHAYLRTMRESQRACRELMQYNNVIWLLSLWTVHNENCRYLTLLFFRLTLVYVWLLWFCMSDVLCWWPLFYSVEPCFMLDAFQNDMVHLKKLRLNELIITLFLILPLLTSAQYEAKTNLCNCLWCHKFCLTSRVLEWGWCHEHMNTVR